MDGTNVDCCDYYKADDGQNYTIYAQVEIKCNLPSGITYAPTTSPTYKPTISPTLDPTISTTHQWFIGQNFGTQESPNYEFSFEFGCTTSGCGVIETVGMFGMCVDPVLTIEIVETDYWSTSEHADVSINGDSSINCVELDDDCTLDWVTCEDINNLDISSYIDEEKGFNSISLYAVIDSLVDYCPYNGYYLYVRATFGCSRYKSTYYTEEPSNFPTTAPTIAPTPPDYVWYVGRDYSTINNTISYKFESDGFGCSSSGGCSVTKYIEIVDGETCTNPKLTVEIVETDYLLPTEQVSVYIGGDFIDNCDSLDENCTYEWVTCESIKDYDITAYVHDINDGINIAQTETAMTPETRKFFSLTFESSSYVDSCPYQVDGMDYYLYGKFTLSCDSYKNQTHLPSPVPTAAPSMAPSPAPTNSPTFAHS